MLTFQVISQLQHWASEYMDSAYHAGKKPGLEGQERLNWQILDDELTWFIERGQMPAPYSSFLGCAGIGYLIVHLTACFWDMSSRQAMLKLRGHVRALLAGPASGYADYMLASDELPQLYKLFLDRAGLEELSNYLWERAIGIRSGEHGDRQSAPSGSPNSAVPAGPEDGALRILESRRVSGFHDVQPGRLGSDWRRDMGPSGSRGQAELLRRHLLGYPERSDARA